MKPVLFFRPQQMDHTENRTCELGNDRCKRRRTDTHTEAADEKQVEHNVDARRHDQIDQRVAAVTDGLQDADENVIHDKSEGTRKIRAEILNRLRKHIGRRSHQHQDLRCQIHADHSQCKTGRDSEGHGRVNCLLQIVSVFRSIVPRDDNTGTHRDTIDETDHQKDQISR